MGLNRANLPDYLLRCVAPSDRRAAGLPCPVSDLTIEDTANAKKDEHKREKELQNQIIGWLSIRGITVIRSRMDKKSSNNVGTPDLLFAVRGRAVALEVKLPGCKPTPGQEKFLCALAGNGWKIAIVHSLDEARSVVEAIK